jgi:hypothetical protein
MRSLREPRKISGLGERAVLGNGSMLVVKQAAWVVSMRATPGRSGVRADIGTLETLAREVLRRLDQARRSLPPTLVHSTDARTSSSRA